MNDHDPQNIIEVDPKKYYSINELLDVHGYYYEFIWKAVNDKQLKAVRKNSSIRILGIDYLEWAENKTFEELESVLRKLKKFQVN